MRDPVTGAEWEKLSSGERAVTPILDCTGCGRTKTAPTGTLTDLFPSEQCGDCPPRRCPDCGEMDSAAKHCSCWTDLTAMSHADVKALFAEDGTFNVAPDGTLSIGGPPCACRQDGGEEGTRDA